MVVDARRQGIEFRFGAAERILSGPGPLHANALVEQLARPGTVVRSNISPLYSIELIKITIPWAERFSMER